MLGCCTFKVEAHPLTAVADLGEPLARLVEGRLHLEQAQTARRPTASDHRTDHVTVARDGREARVAGDQRLRIIEGGDDRHSGQHISQGGTQFGGCGDDIDGVARALGQRGPWLVGTASVGGRHHQRGTASVVGAQPSKSRDSRLVVGDSDSVGRRPQCRGHRGLVPVLNPDESRNRAQQPRHLLACCEQGGAAVATGQAKLEGLDPCLERCAVTVCLLVGQPQRLDSTLNLGKRASGLLMLLVEPQFALVEACYFILERAERCGSAIGPGASPLDLLGQTSRLGVAGLEALAGSGHLTGESRESLASIGHRSRRGLEPSLLGGQNRLGLGAVAHGIGQGGTVDLHLTAEVELLGTRLTGLPLELGGVAARRLVGGVGGQQAHAVGGQRERSVEPLAQGGQPVPRLLGTSEHRSVSSEIGLKHGLPRLVGGHRRLNLGLTLAQGGLVGHLLLEGGRHRNEIVGKQPQPGVA
ncbi:unannotated protein [freshwater metagenome]|uniref:Unannotated protein n=1 Tax=freshwater metagenome TaxID=449393 RepID=A0A6J7IZ64_9ZZZZ